MKSKFLVTFTVLIFSFLSIQVSARTIGEDWPKYFPNEPVIPSIANWADYVRLTDQQCGPAVLNIKKLIDSYSKAAAFSKTKDAKKLSDTIHTYLLKTIGEDSPCFKDVANVYLVGSASLLFPSLDEINPVLLSREERLPNHRSWELMLQTAALVNQDVVVALTPGQRRQLGDAWMAKSSSGNYQLLAAYDCGPSRIWIDVALPPLSLAATLVHELDHLYRDKFVPLSLLKEEFGNKNKSEINWKNVLLMDESLAIVHSMVQFKGMQSTQGRRDPSTSADWFKAGAGHVKFIPFQLKDDAPLLDPSGPFLKLFSIAQIAFEPHYFINQTFLRKGYVAAAPRFQQVSEPVMQLYKIVSDTYFPGTQFNENDQQALNPEMHSTALGPFSYVSTTTRKSARQPATFGILFSDIIAISEAVQKPSASCEAYKEAVHNEDSGLQSYVGLQFSTTAKPGQEGVRIGQEGVRIGQEGVRVGQEGVRVGQDGVRPTVRPCLLQQKHL